MEINSNLIFLLTVVAHFINCTLAKAVVIERSGNGRIVGGEATTEERFPYYRSYCVESDCCSGVNLNKNWLITTASCVSYFVKNSNDEVSYIVHPRYDPELNLFDVALINIESDSEFFVQLPSRNEDIFHGTKAVIVGTTLEGSIESANVTTLNYDKCKVQFPNKVAINMICAGGSEANACTQDLGSPLLIENKLIGIYSWGDEDCSSGKPGVFMRIAHQEIYNFITSNIGN